MTVPAIAHPSLRVEKRYRVVFRDRERVRILQVGCGGTGSFVAGSLARVAHTHRAQGRGLDVTFIDPDVVTESNVGRQNFCPADVGRPKAEVLSERYNFAYGWNSAFAVCPFKDWDSKGERAPYGEPVFVIGAVDTGDARREIAKRVDSAWDGWWWLDLGNHRHAGQVLVGNRSRGSTTTESWLGKMGLCLNLPAPHVQHPELLRNDPVREVRAASCAERVASGEQGFFVNQMVAAVAAQYLHDMIVERELRQFATYFDLREGSVRSLAITESNLLKYLGRHGTTTDESDVREAA